MKRLKPFFINNFPALNHKAWFSFAQIADNNYVCQPPRAYSPGIIYLISPCRIKGCHFVRFHSRNPNRNRLADTRINMSLFFNIFQMLVIRAKHALLQRYSGLQKSFQEALQISCTASFPHKNTKTSAQLFQSLFCCCTFMVIHDTCSTVGLHIFPCYARRMPIYDHIRKCVQLIQRFPLLIKYVNKTHHLPEPKHPWVCFIGQHVFRQKFPCTIGVNFSGRNRGRYHNICIYRYIFRCI